MKRKLTRDDIRWYAKTVGILKYGILNKEPGFDLKSEGFYLVVDDKTGEVVFRFYVAPNQRRKTGASRTLLRIKRREHEPSAMVAMLPSATLYFVAHEKIGHMITVPAKMTNCARDYNVQCFVRFDSGENYTEWNAKLNDIYDFEFQLY